MATISNSWFWLVRQVSDTVPAHRASSLRDRPFNLQGGGYGFLFRSEIFFLTTLGYMTKTLNQIIFFSSTKIRIFFSATLGISIFFLEKNHNPPFKLNGPSLTNNNDYNLKFEQFRDIFRLGKI